MDEGAHIAGYALAVHGRLTGPKSRGTTSRLVRLMVSSSCLTAPVGGEGKVAVEKGHSLSRFVWIIVLVLVAGLMAIPLTSYARGGPPDHACGNPPSNPPGPAVSPPVGPPWLARTTAMECRTAYALRLAVSRSRSDRMMNMLAITSQPTDMYCWTI